MDPFYEIKLKELVLFDRVVALGTITAAAKELSIPKPSASRWLAQLEQDVGHALLRRTTRYVSLTARGEAFHSRVQQVLLAVRAAHDVLEAENLVGTLQMSMPVLPGQVVLGAVLTRFRDELPGVQLKVRLQNERVNLVRDGFDVAVVGGTLQDSSLVARRLASAPIRLYVGVQFDSADPYRLPWLATPADVRDLRIHLPALGQPVVVVNDRHIIAEAICAGAGMAALPTFLGEPAVERGKLRRICPEIEFGETPVHALYLAAQRDDLRITRLLDILSEQMGVAFGGERKR